jgi:hypothetical protein
MDIQSNNFSDDKKSSGFAAIKFLVIVGPSGVGKVTEIKFREL